MFEVLGEGFRNPKAGGEGFGFKDLGSRVRAWMTSSKTRPCKKECAMPSSVFESTDGPNPASLTLSSITPLWFRSVRNRER